MIDSYKREPGTPLTPEQIKRLDELKEASPWAFTIGSAFFDKDFTEDIPSAVDMVCRYMNGE